MTSTLLLTHTRLASLFPLDGVRAQWTEHGRIASRAQPKKEKKKPAAPKEEKAAVPKEEKAAAPEEEAAAAPKEEKDAAADAEGEGTKDAKTSAEPVKKEVKKKVAAKKSGGLWGWGAKSTTPPTSMTLTKPETIVVSVFGSYMQRPPWRHFRLLLLWKVRPYSLDFAVAFGCFWQEERREMTLFFFVQAPSHVVVC